MDAVLYIQDNENKIYYWSVDFYGINIQPVLNEIINAFISKGFSIKYSLIEIFKSKHIFVFRNFLTNVGFTEYDVDELYDKVENNLEIEEFFNQCFTIKIDFKDKKFDPNEIFKNRLN